MSSCSCDYESPEFYRHATQVARVQHRCAECRRTIAAGERYHRFVGKWEGEFAAHLRCSHCETVAATLRDMMPCFCDSFGGLWETIADGWLDDLRSAETGDYFRVMRLVVAAKHASTATTTLESKA
jgi:hypothetical protein